jgi:hypothetical protein
MAEQPPLNRSYVISYAGNDRSFPVIGLRLDPRVAGYRVPEDLSPHPDSKRYPNHVFTGSQPSNGDERVTHVYEILPDPYVPFTRYDDDLGPIQGRRRSVKNEGQVARLGPNQRVNYEAREGSAIVYTEIEEEWSIETDEDGNSLFPFKDRDFYEPSRGAIQERRQLFVPTGEEEGTLENVNGVITQTSYEPYNEFLSVKIVQTYKVNGPQLVGRATDNDGQLVTVTTQRKGSDGYIPPNPTATRTVEVNREDAESLVERIVDTPEIFTAQTFSVERPDPIPQKFRVAVPIQTSQEVVEGQAELPELLTGEISRNEEQRNKFLKRVSATSRDQAVLPQTLLQKSTDNDRQEVTVTETLQLGDTNETATATTTISSEALGDGNYVITKTEIPEVFSSKVFSKERPDPVPQKFRVLVPSLTEQENIEGTATEPQLTTGEIAKSEQQVNKFVKRVSATTRDETQLPQSLTQKSTTEQGLLATVSETLQSGDTSETPTALKSVDSEAMGDGTFVVRVTEIPKVFAGETFSVERPDPLPQKFRVAARTLTSQQTIEGVADPLVDLSSGQISKSEQQVTEFIKRTSVTSRDQTQLPVTLEQKSTDNEKQVVTVTQTLQSADTIELPTATTTVESEALGDGNYLVTKTEVPEVFGAEAYRKTREDLTPQKFRAAQEDTVFEQTLEGVANPNITLETGEFAKSEQQVNKFVKRVATTSRAITEAVTLLEKVLTPDGQIGTRILTLASGDQSFVPSALLVDASVEALGDGRTVKTETTTPEVFGNVLVSRERLDPIPAKFRSKLLTRTQQFNTVGSTPFFISLGQSELSRSEQQVNQFVKRVTTVSRDFIGLTSITGGEVYTSELGGGVAQVVETFGSDPQINPSLGTISAEKENLGNDQFVTREVKLQTPLAKLTGQEYDETLDVTIPFTRQFVEAGTELPDSPSSINPRDNLHSIVTEFGYEDAKQQLLDVFYKTATIETVSLPDRLVSARLQVTYNSSGDNSTGSGNSGSASATADVSGDADLIYQIEDGYRGFVDGENYLFFLPKEDCNFTKILEKINESEQDEVVKWPIVRPKSYRFYIPLRSERKSASVAVSLPNNISRSNSGSVSTSIKSLTLPQTIHGPITIQFSDLGEDASKTVSAGVNSPNLGAITLTVEAQGDIGEIPSQLFNIGPTSPESFPTGRFLYRVDSSPFKFGLMRVSATVVTITEEMV